MLFLTFFYSKEQELKAVLQNLQFYRTDPKWEAPGSKNRHKQLFD